MIDKFFILLAERKNNENDLSDVTWVLCNISPEFKKLFFEFIFEKSINQIEPLEIMREYSSENGKSRIDFKFESQDKKYLVENKIYDKSHHYKEYTKNYPDSEIGFIANYQINEKKFYKYNRTWEDFYKHLKNEIKNVEKDTETMLIEGYRKYLMEVCSIMDVKKFNLSKISSLEAFHIILEKAINSYENGKCKMYNKISGTEPHRSGKYFEITFDNTEETYYPWIGVYTADYSQNLCLGIRKDWDTNLKLYNALENSNLEESDYFKKPYSENNEFWFELKEGYLKKLNTDPERTKEETEEKIRIIIDFFNKTVDCCANSLKK